MIVTFIDISVEVEHLQTQDRYQRAFLEATQNTYPNVDIALQKATEVIAKTLYISRVSVWLYNDNKDELKCINLFSLDENSHSKGTILKASKYPKYFNTLKDVRVIAFDDAQKYDWSREFIHDYLIPLNIKSILNIPIMRQGEVIGIVSNKQIAKIREWSSPDIEFTTAIANWVALILEIEHRKEAEILLKEKTEQIIQQNRLAQMGEMMSMIAHQWRQPLNAISCTSGAMQIKALRDKIDKEMILSKTQEIADYAQHLSRTIDDFRDFFKPNKKMKLTSYKKIIESVLGIIKASIQNHNIDLIQDLKCDKKFQTYENEIKQVILNLIKNAEDILIDNSIKEPFIKISTFIENEFYILEVTDNGGGISKDIIGKIFDPYFSTKTKKDGTGLGLYMSKMIIEEHCNGKLEVYNTDCGATFKITLGEK